MRAWDEPEVPQLPGRGSLPAVCDTATGSRVTVGGPTARMYVCGITPYDATHIGHAATYIAFDLLVRAWHDAGCDVTYVQNITDVDDPLLERAALTGEEWDALAERDIELFRKDMTALRVLPPQQYIGAVEAMGLVINAVDRLRSSGAVYRVEDDLYFAVGSDPDFGSVGHLDKDTMRSWFGERGGDPDRPGKRDPLDCLVWRAERAGEPAWDSPFGRGRPGWHVECTAIARTYLGQTFDVQGGGRDLIFPHHEMCASQAHVIDDAPFARAYVHAGMVGLGGEKMSKSRGNLVFVSSVREQGVDPMALRLAILAHRYRDDWSWEDADLELAVQRLARWRAAVDRPGAGRADDLLVRLRAAIVDDLDAPSALAAVDEWAAGGVDAGDARAGESDADLVVAAVDALLGVRL